MDFKPDPNAIRPWGIIQNAKAIKHCLEYLAVEAKKSNLPFASHLIGVAADALQESINVTEKAQEEMDTQSMSRPDNGHNGARGHIR